MYVDLDLAALRTYRSAQKDPPDFDDFWRNTLSESRDARESNPISITHVETGLTTVEVYDVTFPGYLGQPIKAWLRIPAGATSPLATVVQFVGYGGGRGGARDDLLWASCGYAHIVMDNRGQGSEWTLGSTPDPLGSGPAANGVMTRGVQTKEAYYYRRLIADAVMLVECARELPYIDAQRVAVVGASQGGGLALAVAGLASGLAAVVAHVPFLSDFPRSTVMAGDGPYLEIVRYLAVHRTEVDAVHAVLSYFDTVNFARRATAQALFSVALMDRTCPPSSVFGAFGAYAGAKKISVWSYNDHEGGGIEDEAQALQLLQESFQ